MYTFDSIEALLRYVREFFHPVEVYGDLGDYALPEQVFSEEDLLQWAESYSEVPLANGKVIILSRKGGKHMNTFWISDRKGSAVPFDVFVVHLVSSKIQLSRTVPVAKCAIGVAFAEDLTPMEEAELQIGEGHIFLGDTDITMQYLAPIMPFDELAKHYHNGIFTPEDMRILSNQFCAKALVDGTLIHGTLREEDLHQAFTEFLQAVNNPAFILYDRPEEDLESLFDIMSKYAKDGHYFGAHPGDGSDFGFWEFDSEEV